MLHAQGLQRNEVDRFTKQKVVSTIPVAIRGPQLGLQFSAEGKELFLQLNGTIAEAAAIGLADKTILLLADDSTVTLPAAGVQSAQYVSGGKGYQFKFTYHLNAGAVETLSTQTVVALRQYNTQGHLDYEVPAHTAAQVKRAAASFYQALVKEGVVPKLFFIDLAAARKHIGDSVSLTGKVTNALYSTDGKNRFVQLQVGSGRNSVQVQFPAGLGSADGGVQTGEIYLNKEITVQGRLQQKAGVPHMLLPHKKNFWVNTPVRLKDVAGFAGDSVVVYGEVLGVQPAPAGTQLQLGGDDEPQPLLLLHLFTHASPWPHLNPQQWTGKLLRVRGRVFIEEGKPLITVSSAAQID